MTVADRTDLRVIRARLGVGDLDPRTIAANDLVQRRYAALYATAVPLLASPAKPPLLEMIDLARVKAVATNGVGAGRRQVVVLATDQPFENLAAAPCPTHRVWESDAPAPATAGMCPPSGSPGHTRN